MRPKRLTKQEKRQTLDAFVLVHDEQVEWADKLDTPTAAQASAGDATGAPPKATGPSPAVATGFAGQRSHHFCD